MKKNIRVYLTSLVCAILLMVFMACGGKKIPEYPRIYLSAVSSIIEGNKRYKTGCYKDALEYMYKAHELYSLADYQGGVANSLNNIGNIYRAEGNTDSAVMFFDEAIRIYNNINDMKGVVQALSNKAAVYIDLQEYDTAGSILDKAEAVAGPINFLYIPYLNNRGIIYTRLKKYSLAQKVLGKAGEMINIRDNFEYSAVNFALGSLMFETGEYKKAESYYQNALTADRKAGYSKGVADDLYALGNLFLKTKYHKISADYLQRSLKIFSLLKDKKNVEKTLTLLKNQIEKKDSIRLDIDITTFFTDLWDDEKRLTTPCE